MQENKIRLALVDMYDGEENLGIPSLKKMISAFDILEYEVFEVRNKLEIPGLDFDIYIFSGGPGSPLEGDGVWDRGFGFLLDKLWLHNQRNEDKKYALFICHSFQMVCHHLGIGTLTQRNRMSLGILPIHPTAAGKKDPIFSPLDDPFYVGDFRKWQVINPNEKQIEHLGCKILALEKVRPHVPYERALMAVRFSPEWVGTQFHPEADPDGMVVHFNKPEKREEIIAKKGEAKYHEMLGLAVDDTKLKPTFDHVIPSFLSDAIDKVVAYQNEIALV